MPILKGAVTFARFRVEHAGPPPADERRWFSKALRTGAFEPLDKKGDEERAVGFVELENVDGTDFSVGAVYSGELALFSFRVDQLRIPRSALKAEVEKWMQAFEKEKGRRPGRTEKAEGRASVRHVMKNRTTPVTKTHDVSWNLKTDTVLLWASSRKVVEELQAAIESAFEVKLVERVPSAMALEKGIADGELLPTAELLGMAEGEVTRGAA